jgi:DNA polymerase iota
MEQDEVLDTVEMDESSSQRHPNVILHLDIDYFYAQVEEVLSPELKSKPFGVKQGLNIVTCNYLARDRGVGKWKPLKECLEKCPELVIVNGEDLTNYKVYAKRISDILLSMFGRTERVGLDEHYIDVTKQIENELQDRRADNQQHHHFEGPMYPDEISFDECNCSCKRKLMIGTEIAKRVRKKLFEELKLTCSVGIAHNKLLAKLVGQMNKPDNQTVLAPVAAKTFMTELEKLRSITGIGEKTASKIEELGIKSIEQLQNCDLSKLQKKFGHDMALRLREMSLGIDSSEFRPSGKPKTVGLEDSFRPISIRSDASEKFQALLSRLMIQIQDDGRMPQSIKVTVRKYDPVKKNSIRETKQCALAPSLFRCGADGKIQLTEGAELKIIKNVLILFDRMVDLKHQFNITLLGLCFSKFQEQKRGSSSIANYLMKKQDVEVQSITNLSNETNGSFNDSFRSKTASPSSSLMDFETISNNSLDLSGSEGSESEPSPKKRKKINLFLCRYPSGGAGGGVGNDDMGSPSKLNVSDLHLNAAFETGVVVDSIARSASNRVISPLCSDPPIACSSSSVLRKVEMPPNIDPTGSCMLY